MLYSYKYMFWLKSKSNNVKNKNLKYKWKKCVNCKSFILIKKLIKNLFVCYKCNFHFYITSKLRTNMFLNKKKFELFDYFLPVDFLNFNDEKNYYFKILETQKKTNELEALSVFKGNILLFDIVVCIFEFNFIGGSMGRVVGEKFFSAIKFCIKNKISLICFSSSGGVRMQESSVALMQMSKVSLSINFLKKFKLLYISIIINPCMGGVTASIAMLGDINISEPGAFIGFTGPKIIKNTFKKKLPLKFQTSEFLMQNGFLDVIINRKELKYKVYNILKLIKKNKNLYD